MATFGQSNPVNVISGQSTPLVPSPFGSPQQTAVVAIYNNTSAAILVGNSSGGDILPANTANAFEYPGIASPPTLTPITSAPAGAVVGTVTVVYYNNSSQVPPGFPLALVPFANGQVAVMSSIQPNQLILAPPVGTNSLGIVVENVVGGGSAALFVKGVQSGRFYVNGTAVSAGQSINVIVGAGVDDTSFYITISATLTIYGFSTPTVPLMANIAVAATASTSPLISNPNVGGALYLFTADLSFTPGTACAAQLVGATTGANLGSLQTDGTKPDHAVFGPLRSTEAINAVLSVAGFSRLILRCSNFGP